MKKTRRFTSLITLLIFVSCQVKNKPILISNIVPELNTTNGIIQVLGLQTDQSLYYIEYFIYTGKKETVLNSVNKIQVVENKFTSDSICKKVDKNEILESTKSDFSYLDANKFWSFKKLQDYEVYACVKNSLRHYIVFDKNSDTIYHRIDEIRD